jgi:WD40 repeat protein
MISALAFAQGGAKILSSSWDSTARSWSSTKGTQDETVLSHTSEIKALAVHDRTSRGAAGTRDGLVKVFSIPSLKCLRNVPAHNRDISGLAFTSDGTRLITSSWDGWVKIWDLSSYEIIKNVMRQKERIRATALSPDDSKVYLGLHNGIIRSVSLDNARDVSELKGHKDIVSALAINPAGNLLASGSWDRTLMIWDLEKDTIIHTEKIGTGISSLSWNPRQEVLYSTDFSGSLISWEFDGISS